MLTWQHLAILNSWFQASALNNFQGSLQAFEEQQSHGIKRSMACSVCCCPDLAACTCSGRNHPPSGLRARCGLRLALLSSRKKVLRSTAGLGKTEKLVPEVAPISQNKDVMLLWSRMVPDRHPSCSATLRCCCSAACCRSRACAARQLLLAPNLALVQGCVLSA